MLPLPMAEQKALSAAPCHCLGLLSALGCSLPSSGEAAYTVACDSLGSCKPWKFAFKNHIFRVNCMTSLSALAWPH